MENPEKYESMLMREVKEDRFFTKHLDDFGDKNKYYQLRFNNQDYWTRFYNDGYNKAIKDIPHQMEYYKYKDWVESI
jgi:hypothetical protein